MRKPISILLLSLTLPYQTLAWGELAHRTIAILASRFLLPETAAFVSKVLPKDEKIDAGALWADYFSHQPQGLWSKPLHYIDAEDDPAQGSCGLDYERDCPNDMCVVGAIVNVVGARYGIPIFSRRSIVSSRTSCCARVQGKRLANCLCFEDPATPTTRLDCSPSTSPS